MNAKHWTLIAVVAGATFTGCGSTETAATETKDGAETAAAKEEDKRGFSLPWSAPETATLADGTPIKVRTLQAISTDDVTTGARFAATLAEPLIVDGKTVARAGANVEGIVSSADQGGRVKGVASLSVRLTKLQTVEDAVDIQTSTVAKTAPATKKDDAVKVGIGAGIGAAIGAIAGGGKGAAIGAASGAGAGTGVVLATRGEPAVIGAESLLTFRLTVPVTVELE